MWKDFDLQDQYLNRKSSSKASFQLSIQKSSSMNNLLYNSPHMKNYEKNILSDPKYQDKGIQVDLI